MSVIVIHPCLAGRHLPGIVSAMADFIHFGISVGSRAPVAGRRD
jgi:hypothetical protein